MLSKGHTAIAQYIVLNHKKIIKDKELDLFDIYLFSEVFLKKFCSLIFLVLICSELKKTI